MEEGRGVEPRRLRVHPFSGRGRRPLGVCLPDAPRCPPESARPCRSSEVPDRGCASEEAPVFETGGNPIHPARRTWWFRPQGLNPDSAGQDRVSYPLDETGSMMRQWAAAGGCSGRKRKSHRGFPGWLQRRKVLENLSRGSPAGDRRRRHGRRGRRRVGRDPVGCNVAAGLEGSHGRLSECRNAS